MITDYVPLVGRGKTGFNKIYSPDPKLKESMLAYNPYALEYTLVSSIGQNSNLKWCTFLPPGTKSFDAALFTYSNPVEAKVVAKFGSEPLATDTTQAQSDSFSRDQALQKLVSGEELKYFSPLINYPDGTQSGSGTMRLSSSSDTGDLLITGGWVYFNVLQSAGGVIKNIDVRVNVDAEIYKLWFATAKFDSDGNPVAGEIPPAVPVEDAGQITEIIEVDGTLTLKIKLDVPNLGASNIVWIGGVVPPTSGIVNENTLFFKVGSEWRRFIPPDLPSFAFSTIPSSAKELIVPLGLTKETLRAYEVNLYLGYQTAPGNYTNLGVIWK